ncbi:MAG: hypothetical protein JRJ12_01765 [Deltaproteobacteria bacterium]|nr:hypothetical protein [Deltaproteobacteria bacterium]MBW2069906.1 hypothetical protein [Deltaproteobacteria bacterium]
MTATTLYLFNPSTAVGGVMLAICFVIFFMVAGAPALLFAAELYQKAADGSSRRLWIRDSRTCGAKQQFSLAFNLLSPQNYLPHLRKDRQSNPGEKERGNAAAPNCPDRHRLQEIHGLLKSLNSSLWQELRNGELSLCQPLLHTMTITDDDKQLDWRQINKRLVSALHRFDTATTDRDKQDSLNEAVHWLHQKIFLVRRVALLKGELSSGEEKKLTRVQVELEGLQQMLG